LALHKTKLLQWKLLGKDQTSIWYFNWSHR